MYHRNIRVIGASLKCQCLYSVSLQCESPIITWLQRRIQNLILMSQYTELLLHGRRVFETKSLLHLTVLSWMFREAAICSR
jgi:hypothetical protein